MSESATKSPATRPVHGLHHSTGSSTSAHVSVGADSGAGAGADAGVDSGAGAGAGAGIHANADPDTHANANAHAHADQAGNAVLSSDELRFLAEIGFMGCGAGHSRAARLLFEGLRNLRPNRPFAYIGMAMSRLEAGANDEAVRILREEGLRHNPDSEELLVFLGLALTVAKRPAESMRVLKQVVEQNPGDAPELRLARRLLGEPDNTTGDDHGT